MGNQAEQLDRARRLEAARRVERAVSELVTQIAFDPSEPLELYGGNGESVLRDTVAVLKRTADAPQAEQRLRAAGRLERVVANTTTGDVAGLGGAVQSLPSWVLEQVAARQADHRALIDALSGPPLTRGTGTPWVPEPTPPLVGGPQAGGEKTELPSGTISIDGASQTPALVGFAANIAEQAMRAAGDVLLLLVAEAATVGLANYLVAQLDAASAAATDIAAGLGAIEAAGFSPDLIVGSRSAIATALPGATPAAYPAIVYGPTGGDVYVLARSGVWFQTDEPALWMLAEPAIGGREVAAFASAVFDAGAGAIAKVAGA
jgi:hypothetical protein